MICFAKYIYAELFPDLTMLECKDCAVKHKCDLSAKEETAITNADCIRAMSDEELAEQFAQEQANAIKQLLLALDELLAVAAPPNWVAEYEEEVKKAWPEIVKEKLDWLKREVEEY